MMSIQETPQAAPEEEKKVEETADPSQDIANALAAFDGAPNSQKIEAWKQEYGEIFCSGFSETELLIWRPLSRQEFVDMQIQLAQNQGAQLDQEKYVVHKCILWHTDQAALSLERKAGSLSTLHEQIMFNSNFVDPRIASALVIKL